MGGARGCAERVAGVAGGDRRARRAEGRLCRQRVSPFVSGQLLRACAVLGIRLIHSRPGRPEGRGKIERVFRTVRQQLLGELEDHPPASLDELNRGFQGMGRVGLSPARALGDRADAAGAVPRCRAPTLPTERSLREAFRWSEARTVSKTGTVGMHGNTYEVDPELAGRRVELVFDPLELAEVEVRLDGRHAGMAVPLMIKRHVHPRAQPQRSRRRRPGSTTSAWSASAASGSFSSGSTTATCPARRRRDDAKRQQQGADRMSIDRSARALGALAHPVHQGAGAVDAVRLRRPPGSCRQDRLDHHRAGAGRGLRRGRRRQDRRRARGDRRPGSSRHTVIYLPNPAIGARGIYTQIVRALGATPRFLPGDADPASDRAAGRRDRRARQDRGADPG